MARRQRTLMETAYQHIRELLMAMTLRPGDWIDDLRLAEQLGLSRTPVREALFLLASEGLVLVKPGGGFLVRSLDLVDISRLFEAHIVLAKAVAHLVVARITDGDFGELEAAEREVNQEMERRDPAGVSAANSRLHRIEARIADNEYLERLAGQIHDQGQRLGFISFGGYSEDIKTHFDAVRTDHAEIIKAYRDRNAAQAEEVSTRHVVLFRERIMRYFDTSAADGIDLTGEWITPAAGA
ncbi:GntR family transcriptional regulator [Sciscionella sediminilitoris]|uniref:GntR family transcriptional regulator n=1 Tax=Sciscionella sediminilitoris TaxID=1445613 RepID=UPI001E601A4B|nr:GntR family transcriptional regulator [Sciscionella sp. SE31]